MKIHDLFGQLKLKLKRVFYGFWVGLKLGLKKRILIYDGIEVEILRANIGEMVLKKSTFSPVFWVNWKEIKARVLSWRWE